jgi:2-polyprenyl-6-methoxyphenol hydroxylase-like FAD-dependent oxidoreductase
MTQPAKILIVGAGPTGLTAAIELYRRGFTPRIIDRKNAPSPLSRAVGISAHSLDILEASGVTAGLLARGFKVPLVNFYNGAKKIGCVRMELLDHRYNFLLALPQNETEEVMIEALETLGGRVEYGHALSSLTVNDDATASVRINDGPAEPYDIVIGADGIHSAVRNAAGIAFDGYDYPTRWSIADFDCADWPGMANAFLLPGGHICFVIQIGANRYRAVADQPEALPTIPIAFTPGTIHRTDSFVISVRQAATYQKPPLYLAGDAAHVHSPAGGRGMNLGIEDAYELARRIADRDLDGYTAARHPIGHRWIGFSERLVGVVRGKGPLAHYGMLALLRLINTFPALQRPMITRIAGLTE